MNVVVHGSAPYQIAPDIDEAEGINFDELLETLIEGRWLLVSATVAALLVGAFTAFTAVPTYRADGLLHIEKKAASVPNLGAAAFFNHRGSVNAEIEIVRSRSVLGVVADNLALDIKAMPDYLPYIGEALARRRPVEERPMIEVDSLDLPGSMLGIPLKLVAIGGDKYQLYDPDGDHLLDGTVGAVTSRPLSNTGRLSLSLSALQAEKGQVFWIQRLPRFSAVKSLKDTLSISERGERSNILTISVEGADPESIQNQVNEIADVYVRQNTERKSIEAERSLEFLEQQLPIVHQDMKAAEAALQAYRIEKGSVDLPLETQILLQSIVSTEAEINELRQQREKETLAFTSDHTTIIAVDRKIDRLMSNLDDLEEQVSDLPRTQFELLTLLRNVNIITALYTSLLDASQELRIVKAGTIGNVRVIDYAITPMEPLGPSYTHIMMLSLLLGSFCGVSLAFARKALNTVVDDPDLIEEHLSVPVCATIAHSKRQQRLASEMKSKKRSHTVLAVDMPDDPAIESIRNLHTVLNFGKSDARNNCIMIAGPRPEVGKSFVCINLAAILASNNKSVLLIDGDLRRGHLHQYLGIDYNNGVSELVRGDIPIDEALHRTAIRNLTLIPTGPIPPNPTELLLHQRFANCLEELAPRYDHIIIDSPPILAVADAMIIGRMVSRTLVVLTANKHPMREIEQTVNRLERADVDIFGILYNNVDIESRRYGSGKYSYQYHYKKA